MFKIVYNLKKIAFFLTFMIASSVIAAAEIIDSGYCNNEHTCEWILSSEGNLSINGSGDMTSASWKNSEYAQTISYVDIQGIRNINTYAFSGLKNLKSANIGNSVTSIDHGAFENDHKLTDVVIGNSVKSISGYAFEEKKKKNLTISDHTTDIMTENKAFASYSIADLTITCVGDEESCATLKELLSHCKGVHNSIIDISSQMILAGKDDCSGIYVWDENTSSCNRRDKEQCDETAEFYYNGAFCDYRSPDGDISCIEGYVADRGFCYKRIYTMQEADRLTSNDNENLIEWIFE